MIKAGIWDLGGVLFTNGTGIFAEKFCQEYSLDINAVMEIMDGAIGSPYRENKISKDEFWKSTIEELKITADPEDLNNRWIDEYHLIEGTRDMILSLKKSFPQYYLSDNVKDRIEILNYRTGFLSWFDDGLFSFDAGLKKPKPEFYQALLQKAGLKPEEAFFVDDKESSLIPAKEMGISTILFTTPEDCRLKLVKLGFSL